MTQHQISKKKSHNTPESWPKSCHNSEMLTLASIMKERKKERKRKKKLKKNTIELAVCPRDPSLYQKWKSWFQQF